MKQVDWSKAPADAQAYMPQSRTWHEGWWKKKGSKSYFCHADDSAREWRETYANPWDDSRLINRADTQEWKGDGPPPVGTVCEFKLSDRWAECEILAHYNGKIVAVAKETGAVGYIGLHELRPIRTPEQIAAEEREKAVKEMERVMDESNPFISSPAEALYDAGYRLQEKPE